MRLQLRQLFFPLALGLLATPMVAGPSARQGWPLPKGWTPKRPPARSAQARRPPAPDVAGPILFTEAEFPLGTIVDGLAVSTLNGVPIGSTTTFGYTVGGLPSTDSTIASGPPPQMFVDPPGIEGGTGGELTIDFGQDVDQVAFGFAMSCSPVDSPSVTVLARDAGGGPVATTTVFGIDTGFPFAENQVQLDPGLPFRSVLVTFTDPGACPRFLLDNLAYPPLVTPVELQGFSVE